MSDFFLIAKISSLYGKNGYVRIISHSDFPERFLALRKVFIDFFGNKKEFLIEDVKKVKDYFVLKFKSFNNDSDVQVLLEKEIFVDSENLVKLPENYFFVHDLIGSKVLRNNEEFGVIEDVIHNQANDVYVIKNTMGKEILIPAVSDFIENFDQPNKILILKPDKDLYEDE